MLCNHGQNVCNHLESTKDCLHECGWYIFPIEQQKLIRVILISSQDSIYLKGYGDILMNRDTFKKVSFIFQIFKTYLKNYK